MKRSVYERVLIPVKQWRTAVSDDERYRLRFRKAVRVVLKMMVEYNPWVEEPTVDESYHESIRNVLLMEFQNQVDVELYIEAQFYMCRNVCERNGMRLRPSMLFGKNSNKRYEDFLEHKRQMTNSPVGRLGTYNAELEYALHIVEGIVKGEEVDKKKLIKYLKSKDRSWQLKKTEYKNKLRTLKTVLDHFQNHLSHKVSIKKRGWTWEDVGHFVKLTLFKGSRGCCSMGNSKQNS